jgi:gliding motility-associated-like protein
MSVCAGNSYTVSCTPGYYSTGSDEYFAVYIDFNGNGTFEDPGEFFFLGGSNSGSTVTGTIAIPAGLPTTATRIRIVCQNIFGNPPGPFDDCGNQGVLGEAIDYCIRINATPVINLGPSVTQCGGTHILNAGNPGSTYIWSDSSTNQTLTARTSGNYAVTVTTPAGCSASAAVDIYIKAVPVVNLGPDVTQCAGIVTLDAGNPGDTYSWSTTATSQTIQVNSTNNYRVTVTSPVTGCSASDNVNVTFNPLPVINLGLNVIQCGGTHTIDAGNPGSGYLWSTGSTNQTLVVSQTGIYRVTVTNGFGCSAAGSVSVTIKPVPVVNLGPDVTQCGPVLLDAGNPGDTYSWSVGGPATQTIFAGSTGSYAVTVTDPNGGCTAADTINVTIKTVPVVNLGPNRTQCAGSVTLNALNPGAAFVWSDASTAQTLVVSTSGTYSVTVTNGVGCSAASSVNVYIKPVPVVNLGTDVTQCGGSVILDAGDPGFTYHWFDNSTTQTYTASVTGTYSVTVTDTASGCTGADQINIIINPIPIVNLGPDTTQCGGTIVLDAGNPGLFYLWSDGETIQQITVTATGIYRVTVTTNAGCTASSSTTVTINPIPVVTLTLPSTDICYTAGLIILQGGSPAGGTYFVDDTAMVVFDPVEEGIGTHPVMYVYTSPFGCTDSAGGSLTVRPQPFIVTALAPDICISSTPLDLNDYFTPKNGVYSGLGVSQHFFYPLLAGPGNDTIVDIYTDNFGCSDTSVYPIVIHRPVHVSLAPSISSLSICLGDSVTFTAAGADVYEFFVNGVSQGAASANNIFTTTTLQNHDEVTVVGANQCSTDTSEPIIFDVHNLPVVNAGTDTTIALGSMIQLNGSATGAWPFVFFWSPPTGLNLTNIPNPFFNGSDTTIFTLTASDTYGCRDSAHVTVNVYLPDAIVLPNVITPDGDGKNDLWKLNPKLNLDGSHLIIFNRWGETVYDVENYANNWGGTYKSTGRALPDGTYYYVLKVPLENNHTYRGAINILNGNAK